MQQKPPTQTTETEKKAPLVLFVFALMFLAFGYGFIAAYAKLPPYAALNEAWNAVTDLSEHWKNDLNIEPTRHLVAVQPGRSMITVNDAGAMAAGNRIIAGLTPGRGALYGAVLYDASGKELHYWPIDYAQVEPGGIDPENVFPHGFEVFRDGSIVVNFDDGKGLARIGPCGEVRWAVNKWYHHAISKSRDGTIWTWRGSTIVQVDPDTGEELQQISLQKDVIEAHGLHGVFSLFTEEQEEGLEYHGDAFHANDIDVLDASMAKAFPMFEAGDLLISLRSLNLVAVIDASTHKPKWWMIGPWHRQHDPDFLPNGSISVYDNNMGMGYSQIVVVYPHTGRYDVLIKGGEQLDFYSWRRGKHQHLENANILITETERGRVFEVDRDGRVVWEYNNIYDDTRNGVVSKAMVLPQDFFAEAALQCGN